MIQTALAYHPGQDRIVGGDFVREFQGHWARSTLMSRSRAEALVHAMKSFDGTWTARFGALEDGSRPYPVPLAVIGLSEYPVEVAGESRSVPIETLLTAEGLLGAPLEYRQLALLVAIVPAFDTLEHLGPGDRPDVTAIARQLFRLVGFCHESLGGALSQGGGSCIEPEFVTPAGALTDLYFLTGSDEVGPEILAAGRRDDLVNGLILIRKIAGGPEAFPEAYLEAALASYRDAAMREDQSSLWLEEAERAWHACPPRGRRAWTRLADLLLA